MALHVTVGLRTPGTSKGWVLGPPHHVSPFRPVPPLGAAGTNATVCCAYLHTLAGSALYNSNCLSDGRFSFPLGPSSGTQFLPHNIFPFSHLLIYLFTYFWLYWIFTCCSGFSLVVMSRGYSLVGVHGLLIAAASFVDLGARASVSCGIWA